MRTLTLLSILLTTACGGNSTGPTPVPPPPPTPQTVTLTGHVTATNGGQGLTGVQAALGMVTAATGANGLFTATMLPTGSLSLALTGSGIVPRRLQVAMLATRDLAVDAIALDGQFDLSFYQAFARDRLESGFLQPLRHWTTNLNVYLQTGADARTLDMVEAVARASVSEWSSGRLGVASVERGDGSRVGQAGWLTVLFSQEVGHCGLADVGLSGGSITFYPNTPNCGCGGYQVRPTAVRHEVGHSLGFFHTQDTVDVMYPIANQCDIPITARERYHAAIAYSRPVGNQDPDSDPTGSVNLAPMQKR
jgi:hypothetical protein